MQDKKLTGWLILLLAWIGVGGINSFTALSRIEETWRPQMAAYPSLQTAVMAFQGFTGAGIIAWLYTGWVLYQRQPGTLSKAKNGLLVGAVLRVAGAWSIMSFGGLPISEVRHLAPEASVLTFLIVGFTCTWYCYLARSQKVGELYAD